MLQAGTILGGTYQIIEEIGSGGGGVASPNRVVVEENLTLLAAKQYALEGKTAVLNFANPIEPGGGVLRGANAQEEYLCRASNLYFSLVSSQAGKYYEIHNNIIKRNQANSMFIGTDSVIYSPNITIIKEDIGYIPGESSATDTVFINEWFHVDVISCAAPFFSRKDYVIPNGDLQIYLKLQWKMIFVVKRSASFVKTLRRLRQHFLNSLRQVNMYLAAKEINEDFLSKSYIIT